jgi:hypothetical protein
VVTWPLLPDHEPQIRFYPVMSKFQVEAFRARTMIAGSFGRYLAISARDHEIRMVHDDGAAPRDVLKRTISNSVRSGVAGHSRG